MSIRSTRSSSASRSVISSSTGRRTLPPVIALLLVAGCGGGGGATVTVTTPSGVATTANADDAPSSGQDNTSTGINAGATETAIGSTGVDGNLEFKVRGFSATAGRVPGQPYADPIAPAIGAKMIIVDVTVKNAGKKASMPFCGGGDTVLIDKSDRNFNPIAAQYSVAGNEDVCSDLNPGFKRDVKLVFEIPKEALVAAVALWDNDEPNDYAGSTWVRVTKP